MVQNSTKKDLLASEQCGCYYCLAIFSPTEIVEWAIDGIALCPRCCVDSVVCGPITVEFLNKMREYWFE
jgi:hypothetical protein